MESIKDNFKKELKIFLNTVEKMGYVNGVVMESLQTQRNKIPKKWGFDLISVHP